MHLPGLHRAARRASAWPLLSQRALSPGAHGRVGCGRGVQRPCSHGASPRARGVASASAYLAAAV